MVSSNLVPNGEAVTRPTRPHGRARSLPALGSGAVFALWAASASAQDYNTLGREGHALWDCAAHAVLVDDKKEEFRGLFQAGHADLTGLMTALIHGDLHSWNTQDIPKAVRQRFLPGPSVEFSLGVMWARYADAAREATWPDTGATFEVRRAKQVEAAQAHYDRHGCDGLMEARR